MSVDLRAAIGAHLAARRADGYRLDGHEYLLGAFLDSLEARGETRITVPAALAFATAPAGTARLWHAQRLAPVRSFAGYVHGLDPAAADPVPDGLIPARAVRRIPTCIPPRRPPGSWPRPARCPRGCWPPASARSSGCWPVPGIRSGEARALDASDLDTPGQVLTVTGKPAPRPRHQVVGPAAHVGRAPGQGGGAHPIARPGPGLRPPVPGQARRPDLAQLVRTESR